MRPEDLDRHQRRCPRLGGPVAFRYCLGAEDGEGPCHKTIDCWWEQFDVAAFLKARLSEDAFNALLRKRPVPKTTHLLELIERARARIAGK